LNLCCETTVSWPKEISTRKGEDGGKHEIITTEKRKQRMLQPMHIRWGCKRYRDWIPIVKFTNARSDKIFPFLSIRHSNGAIVEREF
jgi:hypothetical protein